MRDDLRLVTNGLMYRIEQRVKRRSWFRLEEVWEPITERAFGRFARGNPIWEAGNITTTIRALQERADILDAEKRGWRPIDYPPLTEPIPPPPPPPTWRDPGEQTPKRKRARK